MNQTFLFIVRTLAHNYKSVKVMFFLGHEHMHLYFSGFLAAV